MKLLWTYRALGLGIGVLGLLTGCHSDDWQDVDGKVPELALNTQHERTELGRTIVIGGDVSDADGIAAISLVCHPLNLNKTINILEIYGEPLSTYKLDYRFKLQGEPEGEDFTIDVTVTDVGGRTQKGEVRVTLDGDFSAPYFTAAPDREVSVLLKQNTVFNLQFSVQDNRIVDYVEIDLLDITGGEAAAVSVSGFPRRLDGNGTGSFSFGEKLPLPAKEAKLKALITAYDREANEPAHSVSIESVINVGALQDYEHMYLCDVEDAAELNSDVFGVPMAVDHVGAYKYRARYYNEKAGTNICFLAQKTDFGPICFAPSKEDASVLGDNPEETDRIRLDQAGVYYLIDFDTYNRTYSMSTYSIAEAVDPVMHLHYGQDDLNTWWETNNMGDIWWQEFYFGPAGGPGDVTRMEQDPKNPHIYVLDDWKLELGEKSFILHNWHSHGWWNFTTWRVDDSKEPEKWMYYGNLHPTTPHYEGNEDYFKYKYGDNPSFDLGKWGDENYRKNFVPDNWAKPDIPANGTYKFIFDAHLERARLVPKGK